MMKMWNKEAIRRHLLKMRKIMSVVFVLAFSIAISSEASSVHLGGNLGIGAANDNIDEGLALQGYVALDVAPKIALRGTTLYYGGNSKVDILSDGDFTMFGIEGSLIYTLPSKNLAPYIGGGIGHYMPENELSDAVESALASIGVRGKDDLQSGIGFHAMGGVAFEIAPNISIDLNIKYVHFKTDDKAKVTSLYTFESVTNTLEVDLTTLFATAGLKFTF